jgi:hypothetical protein
MAIVESLRKGLKFFLMSLGISSPAKKPAPSTTPGSKTRPGE